jgi:TonB family protein
VGAFSNAPAQEPERRRPSVSKGGFSDASIAAAAPPSGAAPASAASVPTPVEILFKPRPLYAAEARRLKIEGEVLVELLFAASGEARVMRVVRGLGHGLDENAISAAQSIRFRPAQRGGAPVDSTAIVHIIFQLAY